MNLPIYRALKLGTKDEYVEGYINPMPSGYLTIGVVETWKCYKVDPTTLAIHFQDDMIDSKGNKIFASLSKDGKGGDIHEDRYGQRTLIFDTKEVKLKTKNEKKLTGWLNEIESSQNYYFKNIKAIGIQK